MFFISVAIVSIASRARTNCSLVIIAETSGWWLCFGFKLPEKVRRLFGEVTVQTVL